MTAMAEVTGMARLVWSATFHKYGRETLADRVAMRLAWVLPHRVVKWAAIRVAAHATTGVFGTEHPDDVGIIRALERWDATGKKD